MKYFTFDEANTLIKYYSDKLVGKIIEDSIGSIISHLDKVNISKDEYYIVAVGKKVKGGQFLPYKNISDLIKKYNLPLPEDVINNK